MKSKYFIIEELVDRETFKKRGQKAWELIDPILIKMIDSIKEEFPKGTITINNWKWGGDREWSGLRTIKSSYYSSYSMHTFGKAVDMIFSDYTAEEVRNIIKTKKTSFDMIKGLESGISWLHIDIRNREEMLVFTA